jgi:hypothetical protein
VLFDFEAAERITGQGAQKHLTFFIVAARTRIELAGAGGMSRLR